VDHSYMDEMTSIFYTDFARAYIYMY